MKIRRFVNYSTRHWMTYSEGEEGTIIFQKEFEDGTDDIVEQTVNMSNGSVETFYDPAQIKDAMTAEGWTLIAETSGAGTVIL